MSNEKKNRGKVICHFISNTHWDREWRFSMQRTRHMLVSMLDMLFDTFEKEPEFKYFHMDSQSVPLTDYLEIRPEMTERVKKYVDEGRFLVGPWFCLPDEYLVGGESLVRNLLLGHKIAKEFGAVSKTGYSPFSWGQISQMPQIYQGFGINMLSFYRGVNTLVAPKSEFIWEGPDGTQIYGSRLARRPRYNVWYILQRPVYWGESNVDNRYMDWNSGNGQFKYISDGMHEYDYQYLHPKFDYFEEPIPNQVEQALEEQDKDWSQPHRFWSAGHDTSTPDLREARMIKDIQKALGEDGEVFHSTVKDWQDAVIASGTEDWPLVKGEMHHSATEGSSSELIGWVTTSRTQIKQENFRTERDITYYAEPMAVFAGFLGAPYPKSFIDLSYNWLLQNHGHDSIAGCGRDVLEKDVMSRFLQSREISSSVAERAMMDMVSYIDLSKLDCEEAIVVYNPAPFKRSEVINATIEIPNSWNCRGFEIFDENDNKMEVQVCDKKANSNLLAQNPNDVANFQLAAQYKAKVEFKDVPGMGYRSFKVKPVAKPKLQNPVSMVTGPKTMENEFISVSVNSNGTVNVFDKATGKTYENLGYFKDSSEIGTPWARIPVANDSVYTTLDEKAQVTLVRDGALEASYRIQIDWKLPEGVVENESARSGKLKDYTIVNTITLRKGQPWLDIVTELDNNCENHYLQAAFPTNIKAEEVAVQGQFDVVKRPVAKPDYSIFKEEPMRENPMNSFVDLSDGKTGFALLNEGLKGYEADDDAANTMYIGLLRCYPLRMYITEFDLSDYSQSDKGSQCPGKHSFHYAVMPHKGDWEQAGIWQASERFNLHFQAALTAPTDVGHGPLEKSFIEFEKEGLHISAVKRSEEDDGWVVRLFNPYDMTFKTKVRVNGGFTGPEKIQSPVERLRARYELPNDKGHIWTKAEEVTLEELPVKDMTVNSDGWIEVEVTKKKILTIKITA